MNLNKQSGLGKRGILWVIACIAMLHLLIFLTHSSFLFQGSFADHRQWFKHAFVFSYIFFTALFPLLYGIWYWQCPTGLKAKTKTALLVGQIVVVIILQHYYGYIGVSLYCVWLLLLTALLSVRLNWQPVAYSAIFKKVAGHSFFFVTYVVLCMLLPRFHPLAKYTMFNKFSEVTYVYLLRNENNELVPIENYSKLRNDDLFAYSVFINERHGYKYGNNSEIPGEEKLMCDELLHIFIDNLKPGQATFHKLTLYKTTFRLKNGQTIQTEVPICEYVRE